MIRPPLWLRSFTIALILVVGTVLAISLFLMYPYPMVPIGVFLLLWAMIHAIIE